MISDAVRAPKAPRTWYFFGTLGFALLGYLAFTFGGLLALVALVIVQHVPPTADYDELFKQGSWHVTALLGAFPCELAVIWLAIRLARRQFSEYLALKWPERNELVLALLVTLVVLHLLSLFGHAVGQTTDAGVIAEYRGVRAGGPQLFFLFLVTACIGAPIFEEFAIRGFLFRGWSESFVGPAGAIVLSSAVWAAYHTQYDWFGMFDIFVVGLVLGYFRYRSGSTLLTVVMHSANNLYCYLLIGLTT